MNEDHPNNKTAQNIKKKKQNIHLWVSHKYISIYIIFESVSRVFTPEKVDFSLKCFN